MHICMPSISWNFQSDGIGSPLFEQYLLFFNLKSNWPFGWPLSGIQTFHCLSKEGGKLLINIDKSILAVFHFSYFLSWSIVCLPDVGWEFLLFIYSLNLLVEFFKLSCFWSWGFSVLWKSDYNKKIELLCIHDFTSSISKLGFLDWKYMLTVEVHYNRLFWVIWNGYTLRQPFFL